MAQRFDDVAMGDLAGAAGALVGRAFSLTPEQRQEALVAVRPTIDRDPTDIAVYGPKRRGWPTTTPGNVACGRSKPSAAPRRGRAHANASDAS